MNFFGRTGENIRSVVEAGLCTCCGACAGVCPSHAIRMKLSPEGLMLPDIDPDRCVECRLCVKVCPGIGIVAPPAPSIMPDLRGAVKRTCIVRAADPDIRSNGQSGGAVSALLVHGIETGLLDAAAVTDMPDDGSLKPRTIIANDADAILRAQSSKYCPAPAASILREIEQQDDPVAFVGLSCHIHGVCNAMAQMPALRDKISMTFGLFCASMLSFGAKDYLIRRAGVAPEDVEDFSFRDKSRRGSPGDVAIRTTDGRTHWLHFSWYRACRQAFVPTRCRLCFDKLNVLSDLSIGDPWGLPEDAHDSSVVLVRSERGDELLSSAERAGAVSVQQADIDMIAIGQNMHQASIEWAGCSAEWQDTGGRLPDFGLPQDVYDRAELADIEHCTELIRRGALKLSSKESDRLVRRKRRRIMWLLMKIKASDKLKRAIKKLLGLIGLKR